MERNTYSAVVTGASRGIGRAVARRLSAVGYAVVVNYTGSEALAEELVAELNAQGGRAIGCRADVSDAEQAKALIETAEAFAPVGALINNAGITRDGLLMRMSDADFTRVLDVNLTGAFHTMRCASACMMRRRFGSIVNISSVAAAMGNAGQTNYSAAKAGLIGLTKSAARELAPRNITVNAVLPGLIQTDMTDAMNDSAREKMLETVPLKRMGEPREVAEMVAFLCSEGARYVTGHEFFVDGGLRM